MKGSAKPGSQNAWNHWMMNYMIPFCKNITDIHNPWDADGTPHSHIITMDNEEVIIRETEDPAVNTALDVARINLLRCPPSTTPDNNFLDKGTVFRSLKTGVKTAIQTLKDTNSEILAKNLKTYFHNMKVKFPHAELTSKLIDKIIHAVMVVVWVNKNGGYVTPDKVVQSAISSGQQLGSEEEIENTIFGYETSTVHVEKMIRLCSTTIADDEMANIILNAPEMIQAAQKDGIVSNELMDSLDIVKLPVGEHINKDNNTYYKSSCCVINLAATIRRKAADDARRKSAPEVLAAHKIINAASKAVITKEKSIEKKRIEKERVDLLTDDEKKRERELKAQKIALGKEAKANKLCTARAFLNIA
jgi:hypothetical protein